jgi:hypothetical protein
MVSDKTASLLLIASSPNKIVVGLPEFNAQNAEMGTGLRSTGTMYIVEQKLIHYPKSTNLALGSRWFKEEHSKHNGTTPKAR